MEHLRSLGMDVVDKGTYGVESVDYPDYAHAVAQAVASHHDQVGILICGSGNGVNISANKHPGIRAALAWTEEVARLAKAHNNANVLSLPARFITDKQAKGILDAFLAATFEGGRHQKRVEKIEP